MKRALNFDGLARPYRWLEYATFGRTLERCRFHFLPALTTARRALVFGDGDGRFLARLLAANPEVQADVVDISPAMLHQLSKRLPPQARSRITLHQIDARKFVPAKTEYDLVVAHFFFDCLFQAELSALADRIVPRLAPDALWVVSEFTRPQGSIASLAGQVIVSGLYASFGLLTGLPVRSLPDHGLVFEKSGFQLRSQKLRLNGLLISQLWQR